MGELFSLLIPATIPPKNIKSLKGKFILKLMPFSAAKRSRQRNKTKTKNINFLIISSFLHTFRKNRFTCAIIPVQYAKADIFHIYFLYINVGIILFLIYSDVVN